MSIDAEQAARWPKSRKMADAIPVRYAIVYETPDGQLHAEYCGGTEQEADARAVWHQQQGRQAWFVVLKMTVQASVAGAALD